MATLSLLGLSLLIDVSYPQSSYFPPVTLKPNNDTFNGIYIDDGDSTPSNVRAFGLELNITNDNRWIFHPQALWGFIMGLIISPIDFWGGSADVDYDGIISTTSVTISGSGTPYGGIIFSFAAKEKCCDEDVFWSFLVDLQNIMPNKIFPECGSLTAATNIKYADIVDIMEYTGALCNPLSGCPRWDRATDYNGWNNLTESGINGMNNDWDIQFEISYLSLPPRILFSYSNNGQAPQECVFRDARVTADLQMYITADPWNQTWYINQFTVGHSKDTNEPTQSPLPPSAATSQYPTASPTTAYPTSFPSKSPLTSDPTSTTPATAVPTSTPSQFPSNHSTQITTTSSTHVSRATTKSPNSTRLLSSSAVFTSNRSNNTDIPSISISTMQPTTFTFTTEIFPNTVSDEATTEIMHTNEAEIKSSANTKSAILYENTSAQTEKIVLYITIAASIVIVILIGFFCLRRRYKSENSQQAGQNMPGNVVVHQSLNSSSQNDVVKESFDTCGNVVGGDNEDVRDDTEKGHEEIDLLQNGKDRSGNEVNYIAVRRRDNNGEVSGVHVHDTMKDDNLGIVAVNIEDTKGSVHEIELQDAIPNEVRDTSTPL